MMNRRRPWTLIAPGFLGIVLFLFPGQPLAGQAPFPPDSAVRALAQQIVASGRAAGIAVGLLDSDGSRHFVSVGLGPDGRPIDEHTVFEIGSITKVFTAILLADMARRGEVRLDDPIAQYLPPEVKVPSRNGHAITLYSISIQHSGLPRMPSNFSPRDPTNPYADYSVQQMYQFVSGYRLTRDPGAAFEYSNLAMGLLGHALARRAGMSYEDLVKERILTPLGMSETAITLTPEMRARLAPGHDGFGDPAANWDLPTMAGAGALRSTTSDMLTFAEANLSSREGLPYQAMHDAQRVQRPIGNGDGTVSIAFNWIVSHQKDRVLTWHNGGTGGYRTFLGLDRAARRAVVVLTNSGGDGTDDLGFHLLDPALPITRPAVGLAVVGAYRNGGAAAAIARYREIKASDSTSWTFTPAQLNSVGYWLLRRGQPADAVAVFRLNVEMYPGEANPYDSLGEGLLAVGDTVQAISSYRRSVELNPGNTNGVAALKRLGASP